MNRTDIVGKTLREGMESHTFVSICIEDFTLTTPSVGTIFESGVENEHVHS